jgi:ribosome-associated toxin RatA of RatAB toxin-antitoxin module
MCVWRGDSPKCRPRTPFVSAGRHLSAPLAATTSRALNRDAASALTHGWMRRARLGWHRVDVPRIEATVDVDAPIAVAFALSQTYGELRYRWDPFVREQHLLDGATRAAKGVRASTTSRHRLRMVSEYVSFRPPTQVGMRMVNGPWFFAQMSGGWSFSPLAPDRTRATWRYSFTCRPKLIRPIADPIGRWVLGRDIRRRIEAFAAACSDPQSSERCRRPDRSSRRAVRRHMTSPSTISLVGSSPAWLATPADAP